MHFTCKVSIALLRGRGQGMDHFFIIICKDSMDYIPQIKIPSDTHS